MELKPGYKMTEVGVIPEDWEVKQIGEIATCFSGGTPSTSNSSYYGGDIPWITSSDLNKVRIMDVDGRITKEGLAQSAAKMVNERALLFALYGATAGVCAITSISAAINQAVLAIIPEKINTEFLFQILLHKRDFFTTTYTQGGQPNFSGAVVKSFFVPFPPLPEQRAIAQVLSDVDALLAALDRLIAKKQAIKQATMQPLLTGKKRLPGFKNQWSEVPLGKIAKLKKGQLITTKTVVHGDVPVIAGGKKPAYFHASANRFGKTITISASGASAGYVAFHKTPIFASDCSTISESENYCIEFLYHAMQLRQEEIYAAQTGGAQPHIHPKDLAPILIKKPEEVIEQTAIAAVLSDMDAELSALKTRRDKTRQLKHAMMQELLTGKTRLLTQEHNHA